MVKANIGSVEIKQYPLLIGKNHIVTGYPVADGLKNLTAGCAVKLSGGKLIHIGSDSEDAIGVLLEGVEGESRESVAAVVVSGAVKKECVTFSAAGKACTEVLVEKLRKNGVYVLV